MKIRHDDMFIIKDKQVRKSISKILNHFFYKNKPNFKDFERIKLSHIDSLGKVISGRRSEAMRKLRETAALELSISYVGILSLSSLRFAISFNLDSKKKNPLPKDWLEKGKNPNPNFVINNFLVSLVNYALGVLYLSESGLDYPSRVLLRALSEQFAVCLIMASDKETFNDSVSTENEEQERELYYKKLSPKKLNKALEKTEKQLGFPPDLSSRFSQLRKDNYFFYSGFTHGSLLCAMTGAFVEPLNDKEILMDSIFGAPSTGIKGTLSQLNDSLWYFISMIWAIFFKIHKFPLDFSEEIWRLSFVIKQIYGPLWMMYRIEKEITSKVKKS